VLVTMHCRSLGVKKIVAKAVNAMQEAVLRQVGADQVVKPEEDMGLRLAEHLLTESVVDFVELPEGYSLRRLSVPQDWDGRTLAELNLLGSLRLNLVQIHHRQAPAEGEEGPGEVVKIPLPSGDQVLHAGDRVDVIGPDKELAKFE
jgi:trk system potassium uptake protein TrkA